MAGGGAAGLVLSDLSHQNSNTIAVSPVSVTANALQTVSNADTLASPRIRARNKEKAKVLIGSRVPVITQATVLSAGGTANSSSVQYLDVGLTLEVQPTIYQDGDVGIKVGLEVSSITNQVNVGNTQAYTIGTRNANTFCACSDGETQMLAGLIQDSDTRTAAGIPGLSQIPVVGRLFGSHNKTARRARSFCRSRRGSSARSPGPATENTEFWYGTETRARLSPFSSRNGASAGAADAAAVPAGRSARASPLSSLSFRRCPSP